MGGRASFVNVNVGDFSFTSGGQTFVSRGMIGDVKVIEKISGTGSVGVPRFSHTANRIYAVVQDGSLKYLALYDNHNQKICIDLMHNHGGMMPHVHLNGNHDGPVRELNNYENELVAKIREEGHYK